MKDANDIKQKKYLKPKKDIWLMVPKSLVFQLRSIFQKNTVNNQIFTISSLGINSNQSIYFWTDPLNQNRQTESPLHATEMAHAVLLPNVLESKFGRMNYESWSLVAASWLSWYVLKICDFIVGICEFLSIQLTPWFTLFLLSSRKKMNGSSSCPHGGGWWKDHVPFWIGDHISINPPWN